MTTTIEQPEASTVRKRVDDGARCTLGDLFGRRSIDVKLVSAVQRLAGARCHLAANLLHCYFLCIEVYRRAEDVEMAKLAIQDLDDSEVKLRKFLFQCRWPNRATVGLSA